MTRTLVDPSKARASERLRARTREALAGLGRFPCGLCAERPSAQGSAARLTREQARSRCRQQLHASAMMNSSTVRHGAVRPGREWTLSDTLRGVGAGTPRRTPTPRAAARRALGMRSCAAHDAFCGVRCRRELMGRLRARTCGQAHGSSSRAGAVLGVDDMSRHLLACQS